MSDLADRLNSALVTRYKIERILGAGGMATVFLAQDLRHRRKVAIKVLHPELAAVLGTERFLREIEIAARLNHPHILPLYDSGSADGQLFYVMPYAEGESLRQRLEREKQLPLDDALRIARETADGLDYAHRQGVIHRDIKPENILLLEQHATVTDFGIARAVAAAGGATLTAAGTVMGTPAYMSPEQAAGSPELDGRSDQYALACVVYEMLAGQPPFTGPTAESLAFQHLSVPPRPVTDLRPTVPETVVRAVSRALAKAPADRFRGSAQFAEALAAPVGVTIPEARETPERRRWLARLLVGSALVVAALVIWSQWTPISTFLGRHRAETRKEWVMVAEFDGPSDDPGLAVATRDLVSAALDQSASLATVSRDQIRTAMELAGRPPDSRMDGTLARELAYRRGIRAVVEGSIRRLGAGAAVVVRVLDVESDSVFFSVSDVAPNEKALIPTIERVTRRVREGLGERKDAIRRSRELLDVRTASFEAFKEYQRGIDLLVAGDSPGSIARCRSALALDPDFAGASCLMGYAFDNLDQVDSARAAWHRALSRPERMDDRVRLMTEAADADAAGNLALSLATLDRLTEQDPTFLGGQTNRGWLLYRTGQYEAALPSLARAAEASPFGPNQILVLNQFYVLLALGRLDQARATAAELKGGNARAGAIWVAAAEGNWALTESLGTALEASPTASVEMRRLGGLAVASAAATRGEMRLAEQALRRAEACVGATSMPSARVCMEAAHRALLLLALVSGRAVGEPPGGRRHDLTLAALVTRGLWMAAAGDTSGARHLLATVRSRPKGELTRAGADPELLEAWIAAQEGRWDETLRILRPVAWRGSEAGFAEDRAGRVTLRWLAASAFEKLGRADSAAAYLELLLSPLGRVDQEYLTRGIAFPFAQQKLVLQYARLGRLDDARRHWRILNETLVHPDPEMRPLVEEARAVLASAESARR